MTTSFIRSLSLEAFRNIRHLRLELTAQPVVLIGENGAGKTNLLEAVSLLSPGRGLRRASLREMQSAKLSPPLPFALSFVLQGHQGEVQIGIGLDPEAPIGMEKRLLRIDGKAMRSQTALSAHVSLLWLTPEMDRLLCDGASDRRKFLDRLCFALDAAHGTRVNRYEEAMRGRMKLLREGIPNEAWLNALEDTMARDGLAIAAARHVWLGQIACHLADDPAPFPRVTLQLEGMCENGLLHEAAVDVEMRFRDMLKANRGLDGNSGMTHAGPHRSDVKVHHATQNMPAEQCSTGEQKALLISLMLAQARLLRHVQQVAPIILLDDIPSHLDEKRRASLCEQLLALKAQAWLSGTDAGFFKGLGDAAQVFQLADGRAL